jgi:hypothetical protein
MSIPSAAAATDRIAHAVVRAVTWAGDRSPAASSLGKRAELRYRMSRFCSPVRNSADTIASLPATTVRAIAI